MTTHTECDFRVRVPALDGLRGLAILAVFFYHYAGGAAHASTGPLRAVAAVFGLGWAGVDLFFVLSGFLITGILYDTRNDPAYFRKFYIRRALRIFPPYYLVIILLVLSTCLIGAHWSLAHLWFLVYLGYPAALIWPSLTHFSSIILFTHVWSLSVEEQFYMIWPWAVARLRSTGRILLGCLALSICALLLRGAFSIVSTLSPSWSYTFLFCRMDQLALGAAIAMAMRGPWARRLLQWSLAVFLPSSLTVAGMCWLRHTVDHSDPVISSVGFLLIALACGSLLVSCLRPSSIAGRSFSIAPLRVLGKYSYGFYLYHFPLSYFLSPLKDYFVERIHSYAVGSLFYLVICLAANLAVAAISFHLFESPVMRFKRFFRYTVEDSELHPKASAVQELILESVPWTYPSSS
jgi:peptidoglycan/LPS O-acetylase OafA/YrhL